MRAGQISLNSSRRTFCIDTAQAKVKSWRNHAAAKITRRPESVQGVPTDVSGSREKPRSVFPIGLGAWQLKIMLGYHRALSFGSSLTIQQQRP
jgi:hypothetical protein